MENKIGTLTVTVDLPAAATTNETEPNKTGTLTVIGTGLHSHHMTLEALAIAKGAEKLFYGGPGTAWMKDLNPRAETPSHRS
jgi:hypothetical protein